MRRRTLCVHAPRYSRRDWAAAVLLVALAAALRLPRLAVSPGWDGDEGYNLDIAWHLAQGRAQMFALSYAFVQHPAGFYAVAAVLLRLFGRDLVVVRDLAAAATSLGTGAIYLALAPESGRRAALLGALALAVVPFAATYNRFAYTYNLLLLWTALALLGTCRWEATRERRWLVLAIVAAALGGLTDHEGLALALFVAARAWPNRRLAAVALAGSALPSVAAALAALLLWPSAALQDWQASLARVGGLAFGEAPRAAGQAGPAGRLAAAAAAWFANELHLLRAEWWWPAAVAGLFCLRPRAACRRALLLSGLLALPIFALRPLEPFFRTGIPLLVPAALGLGRLLDRGIEAAFDVAGVPAGAAGRARWGPRLGGAALAAVVVVLPLGLEAGRTAGSLVAEPGLPTPFDWALTRDVAAARAAAAYVNARTAPSDVVLASPQVAWLYTAQVADLFQALAAAGQPIAFYPPGLPPARFQFDPRPEHARYVVLDGYWDRWAAEVPVVARLVASIEQWPLDWQRGEYRVHRHPDGRD
jgi:4-amino-4-deoxy-L-arabinose transferase-like glycosyltransferase